MEIKIGGGIYRLFLIVFVKFAVKLSFYKSLDFMYWKLMCFSVSLQKETAFSFHIYFYS